LLKTGPYGRRNSLWQLSGRRTFRCLQFPIIDVGLIALTGQNLKLIANFGNGTDNIDVSAATKHSITVTNTPGVLTNDRVDMTMVLIPVSRRRLMEVANTLWPQIYRRLDQMITEPDARAPYPQQMRRHETHQYGAVD